MSTRALELALTLAPPLLLPLVQILKQALPLPPPPPLPLPLPQIRMVTLTLLLPLTVALTLTFSARGSVPRATVSQRHLPI